MLEKCNDFIDFAKSKEFAFRHTNSQLRTLDNNAKNAKYLMYISSLCKCCCVSLELASNEEPNHPLKTYALIIHQSRMRTAA